MEYPKQLGQPCWKRDQAEKCINIVAQVGKDKESLFLATHTPIMRIKDDKRDKQVTEEEVFQSIFSQKGEIRGVVRGASGTGKSHLIRWISLRAKYAARRKEKELNQFKIVMVQRDTGSIKAALKQIVEQLGDEFSQYTESIRNSVEKFSDQTIREALITELALVINEKWEYFGHKPLSRDIKDLGNVLLSPGYREWLRRDEGIIAQKIARWTESSTPEDREKEINFTLSELIPKPGFLKKQHDAQKVRKFVQDLEFDEDIQEETVKVLNQALIYAQQELTGIKGTKLGEIFTEIRRKLYKQDKQLAVFIEDTTAASDGLDKDLFKAFEQNSSKGLCRMIALLGMTDMGWKVLQRSEQDRVDFNFDIGKNATQWAEDPDGVAKFAARYLNALRCDDQEIDDLGNERAKVFGSDIPWSKCDKCPHVEKCHEIFGFVDLKDEVKIGLFPFSKTAPQKLLKALKEVRHRTDPRGLLDYVMLQALYQSYEQFAQHTFPNEGVFAVKRETLTYWTDVENKFLGGAAWSLGSKKNMAQFLAEFWFDADTTDECASRLEHYRIPFSLPDFLKKPLVKDAKKEIGKEKKKEIKKDSTQVDDRELKDLLTKIDEWKRGKILISDPTFRRFILDLITKAMKWQDHRGVPVKFAKDNFRNINPIQIEGQKSRPASQKYFFSFDRNEETSDLLEALARYKHEGKESWKFSNGELHKRRVYRWIRKNQQRILKSLDPSPTSLTQDAVKCGTQLLALATILRTRSALPKEPQKQVAELFSKLWDEDSRPQALTQSLKTFIYDIESKVNEIKELLISELGVGQGEAAPKDFIDPLPILDALKTFKKKLDVDVPSQRISDDFWEVRFRAVTKISAYADLHKTLEDENKGISEYLATLKELLTECGFSGDEFKNELGDCVKQLVELIEIQKKNLPYPNQAFQELWNSNHLQNNRNKWCTNVHRADEITGNPKDIDILCFDPTLLKEVCNDLSVVNEFLDLIEQELGDQENPEGVKGGTKDELLDELKQICRILDKE